MFSAAIKSGNAAVATDPQFNYVTMLLHGDGTNGAQNNTFLDSSTNNFSITRNGSTTQGTFSPYGANWSNYFNGSSYLTAPSNAAFDFGSGDFTIEAWVVPTSYYQTGSAGIIGRQPGGGVYGPWLLTFSGSTQPLFVVSTNGSSWAIILVSSVACTIGTWNHIAVTRSGTTFTIWVNGVNGGTSTLSGSLISSSSAVTVGSEGVGGAQPYNGWISNVRVVKGTAVYASAFTPSTTPLTAISGTSLLTCQSNRFVDNSSNAFTITAGGTPSVQRFSPFAPTSAYSTSVIGGSGYFDGASYLSVPDSTAWDFGTSDFTVECWINFSVVAGTETLISQYLNSSTGISLQWRSDTAGWSFNYGDSAIFGYTNTPTAGTWNHIAVARSGTSLKMFLNGAQVASVTNSTNITGSTQPLTIGALNVPGVGVVSYTTGYISDVRIVKGTAVYTSAFTPPTAPLTAITNTQLLTNYTNAGILDNAEMNDLVTVGSAQVSTSVVKYGTGSMKFNGTTDYLISTAPTTLYTFGTGDFTIEMWVYLNDSSTETIFDERPLSTNGLYPCIYVTSNTVRFFVSSADRITSSTVSTLTWFHLAIARSGTSTKMFINGTQAGSTYTDSNNYLCGANRPLIGQDGTALGSPFNGYIDDFRITKGYARYTANFTPPTAAFPNS